MERDMEERLNTLLDQQEIHDRLMRYCRGVDRGDADLISQVYHPDAIAKHGNAIVTGATAGADITSVNVSPTTSHLIGNLLIEVDGDEAVSESYVWNTSEWERDGQTVVLLKSHRFVDLWERREGEWGIVYRESVYSWDGVLHVDDQWPGKDGFIRARSGDGSDPVFNIRELRRRQQEAPPEEIGSAALAAQIAGSGFAGSKG